MDHREEAVAGEDQINECLRRNGPSQLGGLSPKLVSVDLTVRNLCESYRIIIDLRSGDGEVCQLQRRHAAVRKLRSRHAAI